MHFREQIFGLEPVIAHGHRYEPLDNDDVYQIIEIVMGLDPAVDLEGIQFHGPNPRRIDIATKSEHVWVNKDLFRFMNDSFELDNGKVILVSRPYEDYKIVQKHD